MQQDTVQQYFMVVDEKSTGPFTLDEIILHPAITPETLVWKPGMQNWMPARNFPELAPAFASRQEPDNFTTPPDYEAPKPENNPFANNPQYNPNHSYQNQSQYGNPYSRYGNNPNQDYRYDNRYYDPRDPHDPRNQYQGYRPGFRTNWLPWAIVATVLGFFTSCIGAIFGIIGIVQANKANTFYARGFEAEGNAANANAKTMTIIGLIFAGLGILAALWFGSFFTNIGSFPSI